uniref:DNA 3'-5' helicase n=1 Tax=uncultured Spirochaetaceae bacterium TaxID=201186 RepID=A0A650F5A8_9SPIO|nr:DNA helicase [uncultured Spirochaetaceae bacterium]
MNKENQNDEFEKHLSLLNPEQKAAVLHEGKSLLILAGAGSGKTRVITTKIAYLIAKKNYDARSILAVTFTKKAAKEMRERVAQMAPFAEQCQIRTFHSFGAYFLRRYAEEAGIDKNFTVYDDDDMATLVQKAVPGLKKSEAASYAHKISLAKDYYFHCDSTRLDEISSDPLFPEIYSAYQKKLRATGNVDFGDLIMLPIDVLNSNENVARQMHYRYRVIMVDEYQDTNIAQFLFLKALSDAGENSGTYVCVVGDDDQSIYKFRGAEVQNILNFQSQFPGTDLIRLERNYRSTAKILNAAGKVVSKNEGRLGKTLLAERGDGKQPALVFLPTQEDEAAFCADLISKSYAKGVPYNSWAILYRTNAQSLGFESEFLHRKIPYQVVGTLKFYEREEIKDLLAFLSLCANQKDEIAFRRIVNKPARGIGAGTQDKLVASALNEDGSMKNLLEAANALAPKLPKKAKEGVEEFCELMLSLVEEISSGKKSAERLSAFVEEIIQKSGLEELHGADDEISGTQRVANMQELANNAALYAFNMDGLLEFLDTIELDRTLASEEEKYATDRVTLITLHNTKGLEFERVIITGLEQGIFPRDSKTGAELEEERRLFYVGITRAKDELYVTSCAQRRLFGRTEIMRPSVFLAEAGADVFRILGDVPRSFEREIFGRNDENEFFDSDFSDENCIEMRGTFGGVPKINHPLAKKFPVGQNIFHDDYGYGQVVKAFLNEGEYVIEVAFQNGGAKKFLPEYQSSRLMRVDE